MPREKNRGDFDTNRQLLLSLVKEIEIIGEAAARISDELKEELSAIPWRQIVAMRNRLIHAYFDIDPDIVWSTVTIELPALLEILDRVLD